MLNLKAISGLNMYTAQGQTRAICLTHIGRRLIHEDNFLFDGKCLSETAQKEMSDHCPECRLSKLELKCREKIHCFAICDGMGGHNAGEIASRLCVEGLMSVQRQVQSCASIQEAVSRFQSAITKINEEIYRAGCEHVTLNGMGTTLVLLVAFDSQYAVLNVGDSRAYFYDGNLLMQLTKDHTEGQRLLDLGLLSEKELEQFPDRKTLTRCVGYSQDGFILKADEYFFEFNNGIILLCSDGVSDVVTTKQIESLFCIQENLEQVGRKIIAQAVASPYADNATLILIPV